MTRVRAVLSGDTLLLKKSTDGKEYQLTLAYVQAPRVSEPLGFSSREYLRIFSVGKPVRVTALYESNGREFGDVASPVFASLVEHMLRLGLVQLRKDAPSRPGYGPRAELLEAAEHFAREKELGLWAHNSGRLSVRSDVPESLYGSGRKVPAIVERVVSGDRVVLRAMMDSDDHFLGHALLAGVRARRSGAGDPHGDAAAEFLATRLLQRQNVRAIFHAPSTTNENLPLVTLLHPQGDAALLLVSSGLAEAANTPQIGSERLLLLKNAQKDAQAAGAGIHRAASEARQKHRERYADSAYESIVQRVLSSDTYILDTGETVQLASVRAPPRSEDAEIAADAREFARKLLIGRPVRVHVEGETQGENPRKLVTVSFGSQFSRNAALDIIRAGWATALRHRRDDLARSPYYDELVAAESEAQAAQRGVFAPAHARDAIVDASESQVRARAYLATLERKPRIAAVVEHVLGPGRLRVRVPSEHCLVTVVLHGVKTPRSGDTTSEEALKHTFAHWNQRDIQLSVFSVDKTGAFTAVINQGHRALGTELVGRGLASVHPSASGALRSELDGVQERAQRERLGLWHDYEELQPDISREQTPDLVALELSTRAAVLSSAEPERVFVRYAERDVEYKRIRSELASFFAAASNQAERTFAQKPKKGSWVLTPDLERALVETVDRSTGGYVVREADTGRLAEYKLDELLPVPEQYARIGPLAEPLSLRFVQRPVQYYEPRYLSYLNDLVDKPVFVKGKTILFDAADPVEKSLNMKLVREAYASVPQRHASLEHAPAFLAAQQQAKHDHLGMWEYGDPREDDDM